MLKTDVIEHFGGVSKTASVLGISHPAVCRWGDVILRSKLLLSNVSLKASLNTMPAFTKSLQTQQLKHNYQRKNKMVEQTLKEVVKAMCKAYPGGRQAMAGALGMSETQFNNNLYEKNGCRFFEVTELEAMEDISNTSFVADYFAKRRGALLVDVPNLEDLDRVDLFSRAMRTAAARGQVDQIIQKALEDGVIEKHEAEEILEHHRRHLAAREEEIRAIVALFSRRQKK